MNENHKIRRSNRREVRRYDRRINAVLRQRNIPLDTLENVPLGNLKFGLHWFTTSGLIDFLKGCVWEVNASKTILKSPILEIHCSLATIVTQIERISLLKDTIRGNPLKDLVQASQMANAHNFIMKLPKGYDTDGGIKVSGRQKQRATIAIRNPKILLLDEATSALDAHNERLVQDALNNARKGRTTIMIAHRLSRIRQNCAFGGLKSGGKSNS
ncbi:hypothetical protein B9Z55_027657 [Caenorhabditis nigoni]|uniref:ABC transporter domain-containing protein n=1 Tax=Caenorhabditis nigoni TaxID=1611254 RepID=A0A2G5SF55_9PELO|nr:hypothetical protein B9Z55_027657 [Caenorhabditis nigoni]